MSLYPFVVRELNEWKQKVINKHYPTELLVVTGPSGCGKSTLINDLFKDTRIQLLRFGFEDRDKIAGCWSDIKHGQKPRVLWIDEVEAFIKSDFTWLGKLDTISNSWPGFQSARYIIISGNTDAYTIKNKLLKYPSKMLDAIKVKNVTIPVPRDETNLKKACELVSVPLDEISRETWKVNPGDLRRLATRNYHRSDDHCKQLNVFQVFPMFAAEVQSRVVSDRPVIEPMDLSTHDDSRFDAYKTGQLDVEDSGFDNASYQKVLALADHDLVFPYLYHNYPTIVSDVDKTRRSMFNRGKKATKRDASDVVDLAAISDLISMSDVMDQCIHRDGHYDLQEYHTFLQSVHPMALTGWMPSSKTTFPTPYLQMHGELNRQSSMVSEASIFHSSKTAEDCGSQQLIPVFTSRQAFVLDTEPFINAIIQSSAPSELSDALAGKDAEALTALNSLLTKMHISPGGFERLIKWATLRSTLDVDKNPLAMTIGKKVKDCILSNLKPATVDKNLKNSVIKEFAASKPKSPPNAKGLQTISAAPKKTNKRKAAEQPVNKFANKRQKIEDGGQKKLSFAPVKVAKKLSVPVPSSKVPIVPPVVTLESKLVLPKINSVFKHAEPQPEPIVEQPSSVPTAKPPMPISSSFDTKKLSRMFQQSGLLSVIHPSSINKKRK